MGETASFFSRLSQWIAIIAVLSIVVFSGWFTNSTLRAVERTLPNTLLEQLQELTVIVEQAAEAVTLAERARSQASEPTVRALKAQIEETYQAIVRMRESFVFDNLIQASSFHATLAPALVDARVWIEEGVGGIPPDSPMVLQIIVSRLSNALVQAQQLNQESFSVARNILEEQKDKLDTFLFSANAIFILTLCLSIGVGYLIFLQQRTQKREQVAWAERALIEKQLEYEAKHDHLTGLLNRRAIIDILNTLLNPAKAVPMSITIGMIDLDRFKEINDRYGHQIGDDVLKHFVDVVQPCLRETDLFARLGGDEFLLVVPNQKEGAETTVFQRVCDALRAKPYPSALGDIPMRASIGIATSHGRIALDELLTRADKALYHAKNTGRNRIIRFSECPVLKEENIFRHNSMEGRRIL